MTRMRFRIKASNHTAASINNALENILMQFGKQYENVFKTITGDNGSEFAELSDFETEHTKVHFTHPYISCEKGINECHNKMLRRLIPKGKTILDYRADDICFLPAILTDCQEKSSDTVPLKNGSRQNLSEFIKPERGVRRLWLPE